MRRMIGWSTLPLAYLCAGPLADRVFEPLLAPGGRLAGSVGRLIGVGKGRGIALLLVVLGFFVLLTVLVALRNPRLRRLEEELPDALPEEGLRGPSRNALNDRPGTLGSADKAFLFVGLAYFLTAVLAPLLVLKI
jgi:hypothetical protein